jgi:hypothetical protein
MFIRPKKKRRRWPPFYIRCDVFYFEELLFEADLPDELFDVEPDPPDVFEEPLPLPADLPLLPRDFEPLIADADLELPEDCPDLLLEEPDALFLPEPLPSDPFDEAEEERDDAPDLFDDDRPSPDCPSSLAVNKPLTASIIRVSIP